MAAIAAEYQVSLQAMTYRLVNLHLLDDLVIAGGSPAYIRRRVVADP